MNTDNKYNGWANYQTWLANLYYDQLFQEFAESYTLVKSEYDETGKYNLAKSFKECFENYLEDCGTMYGEVLPKTGFLADLLNGALNEIDWYDIAESYLDNCLSEEEEETSGEA